MSPSAFKFLRASSANAIRRFGEHLTWIQEPDMFYMRLSGTLTGAHLNAILDWQDEWGSRKRAYFILCDLSQLGHVDREARQLMNSRKAGPNAEVIQVVYGASFAVRVVLEMSTRARAALRLPAPTRTYIVPTEADARALVEKLRQPA